MQTFNYEMQDKKTLPVSIRFSQYKSILIFVLFFVYIILHVFSYNKKNLKNVLICKQAHK